MSVREVIVDGPLVHSDTQATFSSAEADCDAGETVTGGGFILNPLGDVPFKIITSTPVISNGHNGWFAEIANPAGGPSGQVRTIAICAHLTP